MVAPQFEPRKKVANLCVRLRASEQINALLQTIGLYCGCLGHSFGIPFPGKVGSDLGEEKPITSIRWTTQFVRVRRISDLVEEFYGKCITNQPFSKFCPSSANIRLKRVQLRRCLLYIVKKDWMLYLCQLII